jgi:hypothetical protein
MLAEAMPCGGIKVSRPVFGLEPGGPAGRWCVFCAAAMRWHGEPSRLPHTVALPHHCYIYIKPNECLLWPNFCGTLSFFLPCLVLPVESTTSLSPLSICQRQKKLLLTLACFGRGPPPSHHVFKRSKYFFTLRFTHVKSEHCCSYFNKKKGQAKFWQK